MCIRDSINTSSEEIEQDIEGKVVLYDFWTYSCINCIRTLPHLTAWDEKYSEEGLVIVGIHTPEFEFEKEYDNVVFATEKFGIKYPVIQDNDKETWNEFQNRYWPRKYIADHEGYIRFDHIGEGAYKETEEVIQLLLKERANTIENVVEEKEFIKEKRFEPPSSFKNIHRGRLDVGKAYYFNSYHYHNVFNYSDTYRAAIMLYCDLNDENVQQLIKKSLVKEGFLTANV